MEFPLADRWGGTGGKVPRRKFLLAACGVVATPMSSLAQQTGKVWRVAILSTVSREDSEKVTEGPFLSRLAELGYVEGRNLRVERRYAGGKLKTLRVLATETLASKPDLIFTAASDSTLAARNATTTVPIVFCNVSDPIAIGLAQNLARPGGNITGLSNFNAELAGKRIEMLREILPKLTRLAVWTDPDAANAVVELRAIERSAVHFGIQHLVLNARSPSEYAEAVSATRNWQADAIYINSTPASYVNRKRIIELVAKSRIPTIYWAAAFVSDGGLLAYAVSIPHLARRAADYADRILRSRNPGDLPIEQPTKIDLIINLKTANALGLRIPSSIRLRADDVIE